MAKKKLKDLHQAALKRARIAKQRAVVAERRAEEAERLSSRLEQALRVVADKTGNGTLAKGSSQDLAATDWRNLVQCCMSGLINERDAVIRALSEKLEAARAELNSKKVTPLHARR